MSKTFVANGTGSGQTLSELDSDKIPVYSTEADLDTDLANLEVGQIVATKDTGSELSQPVDVVEEGNLHAVTSNAVAEAIGEWETIWSSGNSSIKGLETKNGKYLSFNIQGDFSGTRGEGSLLLTISETKWKPSTTVRFCIMALIGQVLRSYCNLDYNTDGTLKFYPPTSESVSVSGLYGNGIIKIE